MSFSHVLNWRTKQEKKLRKFTQNSNYLGMSKKEITNFVQYYEKITKWMLIKMPIISDLVLHITKDQKILKINKKNKKRSKKTTSVLQRFCNDHTRH